MKNFATNNKAKTLLRKLCSFSVSRHRFIFFISYFFILVLPLVLSLHFVRNSTHTEILLKAASVGIISFFYITTDMRKNLILFSFSSIILLLLNAFNLFEFFSYYLQGSSFNGRFFSHFNTNTLSTSWMVYPSLIIFFFISFLALFFLLIWDKRMAKFKGGKFYTSFFILFVLTSLLLPTSTNSFLISYYNYQKKSDISITKARKRLKSYGINFESISSKSIDNINIPDKRKNLIFIYLESLEQFYLDENTFPGLIPNIKSTMNEALVFDNISQFPGTSWTIAGILSSQCGLPLLNGENDGILQSKVYRNNLCLGDVLKTLGYNQIYMGGAKKSFAGKDIFFENHGFDEVLGYEDFAENLKDPEYKTWWGLYDDTLFKKIEKKLNQLKNAEKPFNLNFLTIDTHHPKGHPSRSCPDYPFSDNTMLESVHCTDYLFGKIIKKIKNMPFYDDTVVFVMSDHLAMNNSIYEKYPDYKNRRLSVFALNTGTKGNISAPGSHFDIAPTVLDLMGIEGNIRFPLGESLLKKPTPARLDIFYDQKENFISDYISQLRSKESSYACLGEGIRAYDNKTLEIGGQKFKMSNMGLPSLPKEYVFMAQFSQVGKLKNLYSGKKQKLENVIANDPESIYFLITKNAKAPFGLTSELGKGWKWYFGSPASRNHERGFVKNFKSIDIPPKKCSEIIAKNNDTDIKYFERQYNKTRKSKANELTNRFYPTNLGVNISSGICSLDFNGKRYADNKNKICLVSISTMQNQIQNSTCINSKKINKHFINNFFDDLTHNDIVFLNIPPSVKRNDLIEYFYSAMDSYKVSKDKLEEENNGFCFLGSKDTSPIFEKSFDSSANVVKNFSFSSIFDIWSQRFTKFVLTDEKEKHSFTVYDGVKYELENDVYLVTYNPDIADDNKLKMFTINSPLNCKNISDLFTRIKDVGDGQSFFIISNQNLSVKKCQEDIDNIISILKEYGAKNPERLFEGEKYFLLTKKGSGYLIEKFLINAGTVEIKLTPSESGYFFN